MRKRLLLGTVILALFVLGGCTHSKTATTNVSKTSNTEQSQSTNSVTEKHSSTTTTTQTTTAASTTGSASTSPSKELQSAFPKEKTPTASVEHPQTDLNIAVANETNRFSVLYFDMKQSLVLNDQALNNQQPIAHFEKKSYSSEKEAKEAVNQLNGSDGVATIDLGYGITGYQQGAAGSTYLSWNEGNWSLYVQASNIEGQDPIPTAKKVVAFLEKNYLPAPKTVGQIAIHLNMNDYQANQIIWQDHKLVYTISHSDTIAALKMAVSMGQ